MFVKSSNALAFGSKFPWTFLLLLLTAAAHLPLATANGVAKVLNLTTNLTGLSLFWLHGQVLLPLGLAAGACGLVGNWLGTTFFLEKGGAGGSNPSCWGCWPCSSSGYWGKGNHSIQLLGGTR